jgi:AraC-like DNA-binding protein
MRSFDESSRSQPSAVGNIARLAYELGREEGADVKTLLSKAGLSRTQMDNPDARLEAKAQIRFLDLVAEALGDDLLGFHLALHFDLRMVGLLYYVFASSSTLNDALRNGARCSSIVNESIRFTINDGKPATRLAFQSVDIGRQSDRHQIEFWVTAIIRACRLITKRHVAAQSISFSHRRDVTPELSRYFCSKVTFGAEVDEVAFSPATMNLAVVSADIYLNDLLLRYCEEALGTQRHRGLFGASVENAVAILLPHGKARLSEVARKLGQSPRTLARRLASEGLTFADILRELRIGLAKRHLGDKNLTISQIAWLLGYRDVSAFTNAYRRWTGHSPRMTRQRVR